LEPVQYSVANEPKYMINVDLAVKNRAMKRTNFDAYLTEQMQNPAFAARFESAGEAWDVSFQLAALRQQAGLTQKELARKLKTSQQQVSRLESPGHEGHSLDMLRRVAKALNARVRVTIEAKKKPREQLRCLKQEAGLVNASIPC
jgi:ribosome-binding protein aMBF1 (putative translation factor)